MQSTFLNRLLLFLPIMIVTTSIMGQSTISGIITDDSDESIVGANVIVKGTIDGAISDVDGRYEIITSSAFPITLVCSYTGYSTVEMTINGPTTNANFTLVEGILIPDDVVITASRRREKIQEAPASVSLITSRDMEATPNENPVRNLINEPGVSIQQQSAGRINIHLRGDDGLVYGSATYPMLDYRPLGGLGDVFDNLGAPTSSIDLERIEVVRGPGSALYGPGVTAGVIHFISRSAIDDPGTTVELTGGELATFGISARHATRLSDKLGFKINVQYRRGDEFTLDPNDPVDAAQIAKMQTTVSKPQIANGVVDETLPAKQLLSAADLDPDGDGNPMQDFWRSAFVNGTLEFRPQDDLSLILSGGVNHSTAVFYSAVGENLSNGTETWVQGRIQKGGLFGQVAYNHNSLGSEDHPGWGYQTGNSFSGGTWLSQFDAQLQYSFDTPGFLKAEWTTGVDYRLQLANTKHYVYGRYEDDDDFGIAGGYVQTKLALGDHFDLVLAARADRYSYLDETSFAPRTVLVWKPHPHHTFRGGFNKAVGSPTPLEVNIDLPLVTIIPGAYDIWLIGNKNEQTFGPDPQIVFNGVLPFPSLPAGTPGLPLGYVQGAVSGDIIPLLAEAWATDPVLAEVIDELTAYLGNPANFVGGTGGTFAGINLFNGLPLGILDAPSAALRIEDTWELGYRGLIADRLSISVDIYNRKIDGFALFTAISPSYTLLDADGIPTSLGSAVEADFAAYLTELLTPLVGGSIPDQEALEALVAQTAGDAGTAYGLGGAGFIEAIRPLIDGAILATVPTEQLPNNGVTHVASGFRTFEPYDYWGADIGASFYISQDLWVSASYSWLSDRIFDLKIVDVEGTETVSFLYPSNKYRIKLKYIPEEGFRANVAFQHDPDYQVYLGQYTGITDEKNIIDAGVGYKFDNGLTLDISAQNLFNNKYRTFPNFPKIGRRVLGKLTYTF